MHTFIDENLSNSYVRHEGRVRKENYNGKEELKNYIGIIHTAYSDWKVEAKEMHVVGNKVYSIWHASGTNDGKWLELNPTGKSISLDGFLITEIENGKIVEEWSYWNEGKLWVQLGFQVSPPSN